MNKNAVVLILACFFLVASYADSAAKDNEAQDKGSVNVTIPKNIPGSGIAVPGTISPKKPKASDYVNKNKQLNAPANAKNKYSNTIKTYKPSKPSKETIKKNSIGKVQDTANQKRNAGEAGVKGKIAETGIPTK